MNVSITQEEVALIGLVIAVISTVFAVWSSVRPSLLARSERVKMLNNPKVFGVDEYAIKKATQNYIIPRLTSADPQYGLIEDEFLASEPAIQYLDKFIKAENSSKFLLILADSGMGKSTLLLNYIAKRQKFIDKTGMNIAMVPLGLKNAQDSISSIEDPESTVLLLDAFDEDPKAIGRGVDRINEIVESSSRFSKVVLTCRSQFFPTEGDIPSTTGLARVSARGLGEGRFHSFTRTYVAPLEMNKVIAYINRRIPFWHMKSRKKAIEIVNSIDDLAARPMLMAHIPDLVDEENEASSVSDIYESMVRAWIHREEGWVDGELLRFFSESLAVNIYNTRLDRGGERISIDEIIELAHASSVPIEQEMFTGRSLLNRDVENKNYKFSHRSIMEYLFVCQYLLGNEETLIMEMTDQMRRFISDQGGPECKTIPMSKIIPRIRKAPLQLNLKVDQQTNFIDPELRQWALSYSKTIKKNTKTGSIKSNENVINGVNVFPIGKRASQSPSKISLYRITEGKLETVDQNDIDMIWRDRGNFFFRYNTRSEAYRISRSSELFFLFQAGALPEEGSSYLLDIANSSVQSIVKASDGVFKSVETCELSFLKRGDWLGYVSRLHAQQGAAHNFSIVLISE